MNFEKNFDQPIFFRIVNFLENSLIHSYHPNVIRPPHFLIRLIQLEIFTMESFSGGITGGLLHSNLLDSVNRTTDCSTQIEAFVSVDHRFLLFIMDYSF